LQMSPLSTFSVLPSSLAPASSKVERWAPMAAQRSGLPSTLAYHRRWKATLQHETTNLPFLLFYPSATSLASYMRDLECGHGSRWRGGGMSLDPLLTVVWTSLGPLPRWVPGPTTRWAPGTTWLVSHGTCWREAHGPRWRSTRIGSYAYHVLCRGLLNVHD
jgi:hypothetical protein